MSWDVAIFGDLVFAHGRLAEWKNLVADKGRYADCQGDFTNTVAPDNARPRRVADLLAALSSAGEEFFRMEEQGDRLTLRAMFPKDSYYEWVIPLATAFRVAADAGAEGALHFVGYETISFGYAITVGGGNSKLEKLDGAAQAAAEASDGFREVDELVQEALG